jgi:hypothetical protein
MLSDRPEEQEVIFKEVLLKKMSVRETERIIRKIATDKVRKRTLGDFDAHLIEIEKQFTEVLGTRVQILKTDFGGKLTIDYFSEEDLESLLRRVVEDRVAEERAVYAPEESAKQLSEATPIEVNEESPVTPRVETEHQIFAHHDLFDQDTPVPEGSTGSASEERQETIVSQPAVPETPQPRDDSDDLYSVRHFTV